VNPPARSILPVTAAVLLLAACGSQAASTSQGASAGFGPSESVMPPGSAPPGSAPPGSAPPGSSAASATPSPPRATTDAFAGAWVDVTARSLGETGDWTNKVELADLDADGDVDLLFANGGDYDAPGAPVASRVYLNNGDGSFEDATASVLGELRLLTRVIKVADVDTDGDADILLGTTYDSQSRLLLGSGNGTWTDTTATRLPAASLSAGDAEFGDVDGDRDLDLVIADWGDGGPLNDGGRVVVWLNDGLGFFADATAALMPDTLVQFSWDLELVDVDNDWDLDVAVSCKLCPSSLLYVNDGSGIFADESDARLPAFTNNYEFAPLDLDADGFLDLVTVNDGELRRFGLAEHVFRNDGSGSFENVTDRWWPEEANAGWDDNVVVGLDVESDGDADFLIGSLDGPDRLLLNDGSGSLTLAEDVFDGDPSLGTLGMAVADLNGDTRADVVEAQGEVPNHEDERVYLAVSLVEPDTAPPVVRVEVDGGSTFARVHDNRTPNMPHDWRSVVVRWDGGAVPMSWYGENLFWANVPDGASEVEVCATDRAGNEACAGP